MRISVMLSFGLIAVLLAALAVPADGEAPSRSVANNELTESHVDPSGQDDPNLLPEAEADLQSLASAPRPETLQSGFCTIGPESCSGWSNTGGCCNNGTIQQSKTCNSVTTCPNGTSFVNTVISYRCGKKIVC